MIAFNPASHFRGVPCKRGHEGIRFLTNSACAECTRDKSLAKYAQTKSEWNERGKLWHKENRARSRAIRKRYYDKNPGFILKFSAARRAAILRAIPLWADLDVIGAIYEACPQGMHVDHVVPLNSKLVCGLHCEANLQYLTGPDNVAKSNRWWPDMPE